MGYSITDEERERRRQRVKELHAQGRFGGRQPGAGRPRKKTITEVLAEKTDEESEAIFDRLMGIVRNGQDSNAIAAARELRDASEKERARKEQEEKRVEDLHRDDLLELVASQLKELTDAGFPGLGTIVDGEFVEVEDQAIAGPRQIAPSTQEN